MIRPMYLVAALAVGSSFILSATAQTGDSFCNSYFCITGILNGSTTTYELLASRPASSIGWFGFGFGTQMPNSPLVVLWPNSDGSVTLSQRMATSHVMPIVVPNPPRVATLSGPLTTLGTGQTRMSFTIPSASSPSQNLLWSMSPQRPSSSAVDATLIQHTDQGTFSLDLSKPLSSLSPSLTSSFAAGPTASVAAPEPQTQTQSVPLSDMDKKIVIHAVLSAIGFAVLPPLGALWARYARTFVKQWFMVHWILNFWLALPISIAGWACGVYLVQHTTAEHFNSVHTRAGLALLVLVVAQWALGFVVHYVKPVGGWSHRPAQNYAHAILGLGTIAVAFFTVYEGFTSQWPLITGLTAPRGITILWAVWVAVIGLAFVAGMALLPRQYRQEGERRAAKEFSAVNAQDMTQAGRSGQA